MDRPGRIDHLEETLATHPTADICRTEIRQHERAIDALRTGKASEAAGRAVTEHEHAIEDLHELLGYMDRKRGQLLGFKRRMDDAGLAADRARREEPGAEEAVKVRRGRIRQAARTQVRSAEALDRSEELADDIARFFGPENIEGAMPEVTLGQEAIRDLATAYAPEEGGYLGTAERRKHEAAFHRMLAEHPDLPPPMRVFAEVEFARLASLSTPEARQDQLDAIKLALRNLTRVGNRPPLPRVLQIFDANAGRQRLPDASTAARILQILRAASPVREDNVAVRAFELENRYSIPTDREQGGYDRPHYRLSTAAMLELLRRTAALPANDAARLATEQYFTQSFLINSYEGYGNTATMRDYAGGVSLPRNLDNAAGLQKQFAEARDAVLLDVYPHTIVSWALGEDGEQHVIDLSMQRRLEHADFAQDPVAQVQQRVRPHILQEGQDLRQRQRAAAEEQKKVDEQAAVEAKARFSELRLEAEKVTNVLMELIKQHEDVQAVLRRTYVEGLRDLASQARAIEASVRLLRDELEEFGLLRRTSSKGRARPQTEAALKNELASLKDITRKITTQMETVPDFYTNPRGRASKSAEEAVEYLQAKERERLTLEDQIAERCDALETLRTELTSLRERANDYHLPQVPTEVGAAQRIRAEVQRRKQQESAAA